MFSENSEGFADVSRGRKCDVFVRPEGCTICLVKMLFRKKTIIVNI